MPANGSSLRRALTKIMPTGIPKNGINKGWFKKGISHLVSEETRKKISAALTGKVSFRKGGHLSKKHCENLSKALKERCGNRNCHWKGGKTKFGGYWWIYQPTHLKANKIYVKQSVLIAEKYLKRPLIKTEIVHHINKDTFDDRPENLYVFSSEIEHLIFHNLKIKPELQSNIISKIYHKVMRK